jgi:hypothetical protein
MRDLLRAIFRMKRTPEPPKPKDYGFTPEDIQGTIKQAVKEEFSSNVLRPRFIPHSGGSTSTGVTYRAFNTSSGQTFNSCIGRTYSYIAENVAILTGPIYDSTYSDSSHGCSDSGHSSDGCDGSH